MFLSNELMPLWVARLWLDGVSTSQYGPLMVDRREWVNPDSNPDKVSGLEAKE